MKRFEKQRLEALKRLKLLDTPAEKQFDKITELAKAVFKTNIALFSLIDDNRQWFKSKQGLAVSETSRSVAFCDKAIKQDNIFVVNDATKDEQFKSNPLVTGPPYIRFYAGAPVREPRGFAVGTLCVIANQPRTFCDSDKRVLRLLADLIERILEDRSRKQANTSEFFASSLDRAIQRAQTIFLSSTDSERAFDYVLQDLLELTRSSYGLIGEVKLDDDKQRFIQIKSITNLSWNEDTEALYQRVKREGMYFYNQDNVLGMPLKTGEVIIANFMHSDPRRQGQPNGHPRLDNYMGIPIFVADKLVALVGLANHPSDFTLDLVDKISPLLNTIGNLVERTQLLKSNEQQQQQLQSAAYYDELTGLPNRRKLRELFDDAKRAARKEAYKLAVCFLDLDGFKEINDRFGHHTGDIVLRNVADKLQRVVRHQDIVSRLGGDEFVVVINNFVNPGILDRILNVLKEPVVHFNSAVNVTASMGVTLFPDNDADMDTLLRHADQAMYGAKQGGKNQFNFFDIQLHSENTERLSALTEIIDAVDKGQFELFYQPQVDAQQQCVMGFEALIRWRHPQRGILPPSEFVQQLEHTEHARTLSVFVIETALKQLLKWRENSLPYSLSINISTSHFLSESFKHDIAGALKNIPDDVRRRLKLELLETITSDNLDYIVTTLDFCRGLGLYIALDDFGTGYSSLEYFSRLKVDEIKIDRSFIDALKRGNENAQIVEAIISMSTSFDRHVVAEGVEDEATSNMLLDMGCNLHQGYFYCKPAELNDALAWAKGYAQQERRVEFDI